MIKIGDAAVSEEKVVETTSMSSPENKEESAPEKKSTSTKKAKSTKQSRGTARSKIVREQEEKEVNLFDKKVEINDENLLKELEILEEKTKQIAKRIKEKF